MTNERDDGTVAAGPGSGPATGDRPTPSLAAAAAIVDELARAGVGHACVAPGSRSGPLAVAFAQHPVIRDWAVVDERSAGFFALGMARELGAPVAVVCTSGTAAANLVPAVVEASLSEVPLIVLTADRPPELRGCAAPQTIDQVGLFTTHARWAVDLPPPSADVDLAAFHRTIACRAVAAAMAAPRGPVHLNVPLREPLLPVGPLPDLIWSAPAAPSVTVPATTTVLDDAGLATVADALAGEERGLILCGPRSGLAARASCAPDAVAPGRRTPAADASAPGAGAGAQTAASLVAALARRLQWPVLADPLSGLRFGGLAPDEQVDAYDFLLRDATFAAAHRPRAILQLGAPPVSKALATCLVAARPGVHVVVATPGTWPDPLHAATMVVHATPGPLLGALLARVPVRPRSAWWDGWHAGGRRVRDAVGARLAEETALFEGKVLAELLVRLPARAALHVGNSMPVRDLDAYGAASARALTVDGNRGANGIDGVLSSALGAAAVRDRPTVLVVGDLSFLHDLGGLQIAARHRLDAVIVVVNNDGGGVFSFLPPAGSGALFERVFATPHGLDLGAAVGMCRGRHRRVRDWREFGEAVDEALARPGLDVIEVPSERAANARRHRDYVATALAGLRAAARSDAA